MNLEPNEMDLLVLSLEDLFENGLGRARDADTVALFLRDTSDEAQDVDHVAGIPGVLVVSTTSVIVDCFLLLVHAFLVKASLEAASQSGQNVIAWIAGRFARRKARDSLMARLETVQAVADLLRKRGWSEEAINETAGQIWVRSEMLSRQILEGTPSTIDVRAELSINMANLSGSQLAEFQKALLSAFPDVHSLAEMTRFQLGENLSAISSGNLRVAIFDLLVWAQSRGRLGELLLAAVQYNPGNQDLRRVVAQYGLKVAVQPR